MTFQIRLRRRLSRTRSLETDVVDLIGLAEDRRAQRNHGALLLGQNGSTDVEQMVMGWSCEGINPLLNEAQAKVQCEQIAAALQELEAGIRLKIAMHIWSTDQERCRYLEQRLAQVTQPALRALLFAEKAKAQELVRRGIRKQWTLHIYSSVVLTDPFTLRGIADQATQRIERGLLHLAGASHEPAKKTLEQQLKTGYRRGQQSVERLLREKMGLKVQSMNATQLWAAACQDCLNDQPGDCPQLLIFSDNGIREDVHRPLHPATYLTRAGVPRPGAMSVQIGKTQIAPMIQLEKPAGWASAKAQLLDVYRVLSHPAVQNTAVVVEVERADWRRELRNLGFSATQALNDLDTDSARRKVNVEAEVDQSDAVTGMVALQTESVLRTASTYLVYRDSPQALDEACLRLSDLFRPPAWVAWETDTAHSIWRSSLLTTKIPMMGGRDDRRLTYLSGELPGLVPLLKPQTLDRQGLELLNAETGQPVALNLFSQHRSLAVFSLTRQGKSMVIASALTMALSYGFKLTVLDMPKADGTSTYSFYSEVLNGSYLDISKEAFNVLEAPRNCPLTDLSQDNSLWQDFRADVADMVQLLVIGGPADAHDLPVSRAVLKATITLILDQFFADAKILKRYQSAQQAGRGTADWEGYPTLKDLQQFCQPALVDESGDADLRRGIEFIALKLRAWIADMRIGPAISRPSTVSVDSSLQVIAMTNLQDGPEAAVLAFTAFLLGKRRCQTVPHSIFYIDECSITLSMPAFQTIVARIAANGAKMGIRLILVGQECMTLHRSPVGSTILQNIDTKLIGRIEPSAVRSFCEVFGYDEDRLQRCADPSFAQDPVLQRSSWLVDVAGEQMFCHFYPSALSLAACANQPLEADIRQKVLRHYPNQSLQGLAAFARILVQSLRTGTPLEETFQAWLATQAS